MAPSIFIRAILGLSSVFVFSIPVAVVPSADTDSPFPWGNGQDFDAAPSPEVSDMSSEVTAGRGSSPGMMNSGIGHMVGNNDRGSKSDAKAAHRISLDVRAKDDQIAQVTEEVNSLRSEEEKLKADLARIKASDEKKERAFEAERASRLQKIKDEEQEHLASVKRESSLKVKHVRVSSEQQLEMERKKSEATIAEENHDLETEQQAIVHKMEEFRDAAAATDEQAEEIFQKHRAQWKAKHERELQAKGVQGELKAVKQTTDELDTRLKELEKRKAEAKEHLKRSVQDKLLLAAKVKNLHEREEQLQQKEAQANKTNGDLKHELDEVQLTQEHNSVAVDRAVNEATKSKSALIESAKAEAEVALTSFKEKTLKKAQDDIEALKTELARRKHEDEKTQQAMYAHEASVQAEMKEAADTLAKAKWDLSVATDQVKLEESAARDKSIDIVDEARKKAAALREHAREKGMHEAEQKYETVVKQHEVEEQQLKEEEQGVAKLSVEFEEKTARQIKERDAKMRADVDERLRRMQEDLLRQAEGKVEDFEAMEDKKLDDIKRQHGDLLNRVDTAEKNVRELTRQISLLQKQKKLVKNAMVKDKVEWTNKQVMGNPMMAQIQY